MSFLFFILLQMSALFALASDSDALHPATAPQPRPEQWCLDSHTVLNQKAAKGGFEVMFIGDSITWEWEANPDTGRKVWNQLSEFKPATFAVSGDRTEHVLWRLLHGNLDTPAAPQAVVLMIGTNNTGQRQDSPEQIAAGTEAIIEAIRSKFPDTKILLYGIFPRGATTEDAYRKNNDAANRILSGWADKKSVFYVDISGSFLHPDGTLNDRYYRDGVHLSEAGYQLWADSLKTEIPKISAVGR